MYTTRRITSRASAAISKAPIDGARNENHPSLRKTEYHEPHKANCRELKEHGVLSLALDDIYREKIKHIRLLFDEQRLNFFASAHSEQYIVNDFFIQSIFSEDEIELIKSLEADLDHYAQLHLSKLFPDKKLTPSNFSGIVFRNNHIVDGRFHEDSRIDRSVGHVSFTVLVPILASVGTALTTPDNCHYQFRDSVANIRIKLKDENNVNFADLNKMTVITCTDADASLGSGFYGKPHATPCTDDDLRVMYIRRFSAYPDPGYDADNEYELDDE